MTEERRTSDQNRERQEEFVQTIQSDGEIDRADDVIAPDFVNHTSFPGVPRTREGAKQIFGMIRGAFPDHDTQVIHVVAEGDLVATYKTFTGTHEGEFMGVPPTGRRATIRVMDFVRYGDGKIVEHWSVTRVGLARRQAPRATSATNCAASVGEVATRTPAASSASFLA